MKKIIFVVLLCLFFGAFSLKSYSFFDPLARPNNFHGIHILFPSELQDAVHLVNSENGEWGYVTIPIQAGDKDLDKWQGFMDDCKRLKLIPIVRLSTEADFQNTAVWRKPTATDILDFANFLNSLNWPIENRYVIIFNETNRYDEWGGEAPDPDTYAGLLAYAYQTFKDSSPNFFVIMGGLDNAAPNDRVKYMDNYVYLREMVKHDPDIFKKIDGFASHSYPNPGFVAPPLQNQLEGITTYKYEYQFINSKSDRKIPVFITETGWDSTKLPESLIARYYQIAYDNFWNKDKDKIIAITPFLLHSQGGAFDTFSFIKNGRQTQYYVTSEKMEKTKGEPLIQKVEGIAEKRVAQLEKLVSKKSTGKNDVMTKQIVLEFVQLFF